LIFSDIVIRLGHGFVSAAAARLITSSTSGGRWMTAPRYAWKTVSASEACIAVRPGIFINIHCESRVIRRSGDGKIPEVEFSSRHLLLPLIFLCYLIVSLS
jgi:hypothetical protein